MPLYLWSIPFRGWPWRKCFQLYLSLQLSLTLLIPITPFTSLSIKYSFILLSQLVSGLPLTLLPSTTLSYVFFAKIHPVTSSILSPFVSILHNSVGSVEVYRLTPPPLKHHHLTLTHINFVSYAHTTYRTHSTHYATPLYTHSHKRTVLN